jgi:type I restriction enzyme S subunit
VVFALPAAISDIAYYNKAVIYGLLATTGSPIAQWMSKRSDIPKSRRVPLASVATEFSYGSSAKSAKSGDVPVLRMGNIQGGKLD